MSHTDDWVAGTPSNPGRYAGAAGCTVASPTVLLSFRLLAT